MKRLRHFTLSLLAGFAGGVGFLYAQGHFDKSLEGLRRVVAEQGLPTQNEVRALRKESNYVSRRMRGDVIVAQRLKKSQLKSQMHRRAAASTGRPQQKLGKQKSQKKSLRSVKSRPKSSKKQLASR